MKAYSNALKREKYILPQKARKKIQKSDKPAWANNIFLFGMTAFMSFLDFLVLYSVMDEAMVQSELLGILTAIGFAIILNVIPLIIAYYVMQGIYGLKRFAFVWAFVGLTAFSGLYGATVRLRYAYQDMYEPISNTTLVNTVDTEVDTETVESDHTQSKATVFILSIEPLATSMMNFVLGLITSDSVQRKRNELELRMLQIDEQMIDVQTVIDTMENREQYLLDIDLDQRLAMEGKIDSICEEMKVYARNYLADYLKSPNATSYISENSNVHIMEKEDDVPKITLTLDDLKGRVS